MVVNLIVLSLVSYIFFKFQSSWGQGCAHIKSNSPMVNGALCCYIMPLHHFAHVS